LVGDREGAQDFPFLRFGLYDHALVFDHLAKRWWAAAIEWENCQASRPPAAVRLRVLRDRLEKACRLDIPEPANQQNRVACEALTRAQYDSRVKRITRYIAAGDIYQANLAQRFRIETSGTPLEIYRRLRSENPSSYTAFLSWDDRAILSASPELFLELRGGQVVTRPIKGTRPRSSMDTLDSASCNDLENCEKEKSELNMIIDLLRNDLGRVCEYGTVRVSDVGSIEAHPTVFHRVATIEGRLAGENNWSDLLEAAFPGGSIVGAPKIRAMQIIRELEPFARGPYCGAIGWIGLDGNLTLNIAIRTMVWRGGTVDVFAGGAIVAESNADFEYEEILAKAAGLLSSLNALPKKQNHPPRARKLVLRD
jgi:aminodeoxychorismate synthase component I